MAVIDYKPIDTTLSSPLYAIDYNDTTTVWKEYNTDNLEYKLKWSNDLFRDYGSSNVSNAYLDIASATSTLNDYNSTANTIYGSILNDIKVKYSWDNSIEWTFSSDNYIRYAPATPSEQLRQIMRSRQFPSIVTKRRFIKPSEDLREIRARATLRKVIGENEYRRFLAKGFITVLAKSGLLYQIFPGHDMTVVFKSGKRVEKLCVVLSGSFPPTDSLIMRYLMILNDEEEFRSKANKFGAPIKQSEYILSANNEAQPLTEIFAQIKAVA